MEEIHICFEDGCDKVFGLTTHGYVEKDGSKHWEWLCKEHHLKIHPEFGEKIGENENY